MAKQRIRIKLRGYDHEILDQSVTRILDIVKRTGANISGPIPLPTEKNVYCVLRSPHIDKKSREHFEMITHKRLMDIYFDPENKTIDALMKVDLPAGVDINLET